MKRSYDVTELNCDVTQSTDTTPASRLPDELPQPEAVSADSHLTNSVDDDVTVQSLTSDDVMSSVTSSTTVNCELTCDKCVSHSEVSHVTLLQSLVDSLAPDVTRLSNMTSHYDKQQQQQPLDLSTKRTSCTPVVAPVVRQVTCWSPGVPPQVTCSSNESVHSPLATYNALIQSRDEWIAEWAVLAAASIRNNCICNTLPVSVPVPVVTSPLRQSMTSPIKYRRQRRSKLRKLRVSRSSETQQSFSPASTVSNRSRDRKHKYVRHCDVISDDVNMWRVIGDTETSSALSEHCHQHTHVTDSWSRDPGCKQAAENVASKHRVQSVVYIQCEDNPANSQHPLVSLQNFVASQIRHHTDVIMVSQRTDASPDKSRDMTALSSCLSNNKSLICCNL